MQASAVGSTPAENDIACIKRGYDHDRDDDRGPPSLEPPSRRMAHGHGLPPRAPIRRRAYSSRALPARQNWLAMGQVFLDAPREGDDTVRAQLTVVYFRRNGRGVQLGLRSRIDGGADEAAIVLGWWGRQGD